LDSNDKSSLECSSDRPTVGQSVTASQEETGNLRPSLSSIHAARLLIACIYITSNGVDHSAGLCLCMRCQDALSAMYVLYAEVNTEMASRKLDVCDSSCSCRLYRTSKKNRFQMTLAERIENCYRKPSLEVAPTTLTQRTRQTTNNTSHRNVHP